MSPYDDIEDSQFMVNLTQDVCDEPQNYQQAIFSQNAEQWKLAMNEEFYSMEYNQTWKLVHKSMVPKGTKLIDSTLEKVLTWIW